MGFWSLDHTSTSLAAIFAQSGQQKTYGELRSDADRVATGMPKRADKVLLMLLANNDYESLVIYLAALRAGQPLLLADSSVNSDLLLQLLKAYRPERIYSPAREIRMPGYRNVEGGVGVLEASEERCTPIHASLALLLSTSGSTGSPKLVRLSHENLQSNAAAIASYLALTADERPITSLPMSYSYGLSVINSHLVVGASLTLTDHPILRREFWDAVDRWQCTSMAGVPYTYQMLLQTRLLSKRGKSLRTLTQAGGALGEEHIRQVHRTATDRGMRFFVMYGQTEATARISYVPPEALSGKVGSIGLPIPGGSLEIDHRTGELIYAGPNVMMGYAECRDDLAKGDELGGILRTGDLARKDADGFFYITGRSKRILKLFGKRFSLDELESIVQRQFGVPTACFGTDDNLQVAVESSPEIAPLVGATLCQKFGLPQTAVKVEAMRNLPRTARGKMDYNALGKVHDSPRIPTAEPEDVKITTEMA